MPDKSSNSDDMRTDAPPSREEAFDMIQSLRLSGSTNFSELADIKVASHFGDFLSMAMMDSFPSIRQPTSLQGLPQKASTALVF
jgi:hypothetical protein